MKKYFVMLLAALVATTSFAQSASELAKQQKELREINMKILNAKPTKDAKKQAKALKKEGWNVPAGARSIEQQITESQLFGAERMTDEEGGITQRFILHTAIQTSGTYNASYAAARAMAQTEIAAMLKTEMAAAMQAKVDNSQSSSISAITVEKFNERAASIIDATLTNTIPVVAIYRMVANNQFEVQVRIAMDKKELAARLKRNLQKELEAEGDELKPLVDEVLRNKL